NVKTDMLNGGGNMQGGCTAFLIDVCSSLGLAAAGRPETVSQAINISYHAPAPLGCKIRIINTSMAIGARISSIRCEIWDVTHKRLVATGIHMKMRPSSP
ncbi:HotDog domain-containing protein, partial [Vararia minispora EC-137]